MCTLVSFHMRSSRGGYCTTGNMRLRLHAPLLSLLPRQAVPACIWFWLQIRGVLLQMPMYELAPSSRHLHKAFEKESLPFPGHKDLLCRNSQARGSLGNQPLELFKLLRSHLKGTCRCILLRWMALASRALDGTLRPGSAGSQG